MQKIWKDYGAITIGTILIGLATKNIFDPASMVTGGVSGIAIIGKELWNLPLWVTNTVLNIPLFLAGFKIMSPPVSCKHDAGKHTSLILQ